MHAAAAPLERRETKYLDCDAAIAFSLALRSERKSEITKIIRRAFGSFQSIGGTVGAIVKGLSGTTREMADAALARSLTVSKSLPSLIANVVAELARDASNALLRQTLAELQGAVGRYDVALALYSEASAQDQSISRQLKVPRFVKSPTPTVLCAISNICNINCGICETQDSKVPKGNMDYTLVRKIIDQCKARGIDTMILHHVNEPLLHPNIFDILLYLEENGISAVISTNANEMKSVLNRAGRQNLLPRELNLRYSMDAGTAATYNEIRRGG